MQYTNDTRIYRPTSNSKKYLLKELAVCCQGLYADAFVLLKHFLSLQCNATSIWIEFLWCPIPASPLFPDNLQPRHIPIPQYLNRHPLRSLPKSKYQAGAGMGPCGQVQCRRVGHTFINLYRFGNDVTRPRKHIFGMGLTVPKEALAFTSHMYATYMLPIANILPVPADPFGICSAIYSQYSFLCCAGVECCLSTASFSLLPLRCAVCSSHSRSLSCCRMALPPPE